MKGPLTSFIGDDNFIKVNNFEVPELYLKVENLNPAGSVKFKTALGLIASLEQSGSIKPETTLVESSSGNLGVALSMICAARGYRFVCVVDPNANQQNTVHMKAMGAEVICVEERDENGGFLGTRLKYIRELIERDRRCLWLNQYENPANPLIHEMTTARSIDQAFPRLDYLFIGVGTAGTLTGCVQHFRRNRPATRIIGVDSVGSITFGLPPGRRYIPGLGSSQPPKLFSEAGLHALVAVPEVAAIAACRELARREGMLVGGSTGTVFSALLSWRSQFSPSDVVVAIAPDGGDRYLGTIFDDDWVRERFGPEALSSTFDDLVKTRTVRRLQNAPAGMETTHA